MQLTRLQVSLLLILAVTSTTLTVWHFAAAPPAPSANSVCTPGGCTINSACTEQVYIDPSGPTYLYRDATGDNIGQGANAATIIQAALDAIQSSNSPSGRVCLSYGTFPLGTTGIVINNHGMQLVGVGADFAGTRQTVLTYTGTGAAVKVYNAAIRLQHVYLADFNIQATGGATSSATAIGLDVNTVEVFTGERLTIRDFGAGTGVKVEVDVSGASRFVANSQFFNCAIIANKFGVQTVGIDATHKVNTLAFYSDTNIGTSVAGGIGFNFDQFTDAPTLVGGDLESYDTQYKMAGTNGDWYGTRTEATVTTVFLFTATSNKNIVNSHLFVGGGTPVSDSGTANIFLFSQGYNPNGITIPGGAFISSTPANPTGTTSTTGVMAGLGTTVTLTPRFSGRVFILVTCLGTNSATGVFTSMQIRYGTGTAPANGAALTGTTAGYSTQIVAQAGTANSAMSASSIQQGLTTGTAYWFDVSEATQVGADTGTLFNVNYQVIEI